MDRGVLFAPLLLLLFLASSPALDWWWGLGVGGWEAPAVPFHPKDLLPLLPRRVSRPFLSRLNPSDLVPTFVGGAAPPPNASLEWKGACFRKTVAWLELHNDSRSPFGGGKLHIKDNNTTISENGLSILLICSSLALLMLLPLAGSSASSTLPAIPRSSHAAVGKPCSFSTATSVPHNPRAPPSGGRAATSEERPSPTHMELDNSRGPLDPFPSGAPSLVRSSNGWVSVWSAVSCSNFGNIPILLQGSETGKPHSWTCTDLYIFATPYRVTWDYYFFAREHTFDFKEWEGEAEYEYVKQNGISIFLMESGMMAALRALSDVFPLFSNTIWGENLNLDFLKRHMGASFVQRPQPWVSNISVEDLHSGDLFILSKIRGRWGGFETLEKWVTGSYAGHSAVCLRDSDGKLWIGESGHETGKGVDIIAVLPWEEWWNFEVNKDESNPHIALLPLHPHIRAKFNETAAWEYARNLTGTPYGYHNMIFSWIDTIDGNYPQPLDSHLVASFMTVWNQLQPTYAPNLWNEALNKRLGTEGLSLPEVLVETQRRGLTFNELMAIPEHDDWNYSDGMSLSCISFILGMYKAAGLFGPMASSIQVTEFTIKDAYTLKFFEDNTTRLPGWCKEGDGTILPFCQVLGKYRMEVPGYNTILPYPHMNERCPSLPPDYDRANGC
ncbi:hypothetical protein Taro_028183 [Colocasia esculenta]|uniref:Uncharacterized protein n=1 Tax=Colocasia esculenta TaxID=4460 RepID=A0A843VPN3_COLES|nr:hypothetical protein [Colocasia esculenta]